MAKSGNPRRTRRDAVWFGIGALVSMIGGRWFWSHRITSTESLKDSLAQNPDFLADHPELLSAARAVVQTRLLSAESDARADLLNGKWKAFFHEAFSPSIGDAGAALTLVEFTDYTCAPCKESARAVRRALASNPDLRLSVMLLPIGGSISELAARFAFAVYARDVARFSALHESLLDLRGSLTQRSLEETASVLGIDVARINEAMSGVDVRNYIAQVRMLAEDLKVTGVPAFLIGGSLIVGGVTDASIGDLIKGGRAPRAGQSVRP